ncbi:cytochrome d ubiquinol oxidase subunit II [Boudabousia liubingyangii]|uniref:Cytochrome d ubiquinol oxidase subunit II n=1 Tax=Boudabousia liubingyangii TaxID=1921764 RepID=A0A1Q5PJ89_9ACTO|nr:cytochrome d ubiquinol oxidase subunit II [Boudabousia liubingyangii]OKL45953.1 cytochrome d ubiquinol oxidase subunit II [Boudabousia liubingyangii]OKL47771.1 cytochrome d ubiquinol oxidase subunit II [Boudabousia liubingyangii]
MTTLQILWFILIAVLWTAYLALEGFGLGAGMLMPFLTKSDRERGAVVKAIGPHWDGNEVWLLTAGGATFAAFPEWYATMFSGMYLALFLLLVALIVRICAIEWRKKINSDQWRARWDWAQSISAWVVPILLGVAFANLVQGMQIAVVKPSDPMTAVPVDQIDLAHDVHNLVGGFWSLITPFTLLGGIVVAALFLSHGALFLNLKLAGDLGDRAAKLAAPLSLASTGLTAVWALWAQFAYGSGQPLAWVPLAIAAVLLIVSTAATVTGKIRPAFWASFAGIAGAVAFIFTNMAPDVMRSAIDPAYSLTLWDASSSYGTLKLMTIVAVILVPIVLAYTVWSYYVFRAKISVDDVHPAGLLKDKIRLGENFLATN